jgi:U3 small nucleolar RNA-associated protein 25
MSRQFTSSLYLMVSFPFRRRFWLRGAKRLIFYSLPEYAHFYSEIVNMLQPDSASGSSSNGGAQLQGRASCLVLFTQYERMALERVLGEKRARHILESNKATFMFC